MKNNKTQTNRKTENQENTNNKKKHKHSSQVYKPEVRVGVHDLGLSTTDSKKRAKRLASDHLQKFKKLRKPGEEFPGPAFPS